MAKEVLMKKSLTDIKELKKAASPITNVSGSKEFKLAGLKTTASQPTDDQLRLINQFTRKDYKAEDFYVGQLRLANNAIDRDNERFSEEVLVRFAATAIRKTMLFDHSRDSQDAAAGKFFDVKIEKLPLQQANAETGENFQLPAGSTEVWFLTCSFYIPVKFVSEQVIVGIDTGIYDFASIGFRCESIIPITDKEGKVLFWEYRGTGPRTEMTEGSLVYLGAQHGMSVKSLSDAPDGSDLSDKTTAAPRPEGKGTSHEGGANIMDWQKLLKILARLFPGKTFTEDGVESEMKAAMDEATQKSVSAATGPLTTKVAELEPFKAKAAELEPITGKVKELETQVATLTPLAADGKTFRDGLIAAYVKAKALLKEVTEKPEDQEKLKKMVSGFEIDFLKSEVEHLKKRVAEKIPAGSELTEGGDPEGKKKPAGEEEDPLKPKKK